MCFPSKPRYVLYDKDQNLFEANWPASYFEEEE